MGKRLLLIGGGGHCRSVLDSVLSLNIYDEIGIIDQNAGSFNGASVIGCDDDLPQLLDKGWTEAFITIGSIGNTSIRRRLFDRVKTLGFEVPAIIDPSASVGMGCSINAGAFIGKRAVVNTGTSLGVCSIINSGAIVEHDCSIGDFAHVSPGAVLCGQVKVGADSHIGAGAVARQQIVIGAHTLVGIGSVVVKNLPDNVKAYGNPCEVGKS